MKSKINQSILEKYKKFLQEEIDKTEEEAISSEDSVDETDTKAVKKKVIVKVIILTCLNFEFFNKIFFILFILFFNVTLLGFLFD